jgi:hypothetical protein
MWRNIQVNTEEYEELNKIAEFVIDNEYDVLRKIVAHNPNFQVLGSSPLNLYPKIKKSIYNYATTTYSLIHSLENMGNIIKTGRIRTMGEYIEPLVEDPFIKTNERRILDDISIEKENMDILASFLFGNQRRMRRRRYGILPLAFLCSYQKGERSLFANIHSNSAVFDTRNKTWTILEPHAELSAESRKVRSIIHSFKRYIPKFVEYNYIQPRYFSIPLRIPDDGIQGEDYLCVSWMCFLVHLLISLYQTNTEEKATDIYLRLSNEHTKRHDIISFLNMIKRLYRNIPFVLRPLKLDTEFFVGVNVSASIISDLGLFELNDSI